MVWKAVDLNLILHTCTHLALRCYNHFTENHFYVFPILCKNKTEVPRGWGWGEGKTWIFRILILTSNESKDLWVVWTLKQMRNSRHVRMDGQTQPMISTSRTRTFIYIVSYVNSWLHVFTFLNYVIVSCMPLLLPQNT